MAILMDETRSLATCDRKDHGPCPEGRFRPRTQQCRINKIICLLLIITCVTAGDAVNVHAESHALSEYQIKAGFLYNFPKFIEWPAQAFPDAHTPITIGILGQDPFGDILDQVIQGQTINGRKLAIRRLKGVGDLKTCNLKACHILFISSSEKKHLTHILEGLKASSVLTVGEMDGFAQRGGIIKFTVAESQVRLEINMDLAERAGLKISAKLLALAKIIRNEYHGGKD